MDDDYDEEGWAYHRPSRELRWQNVAAVILSGINGTLSQIAATSEGISVLLMADANHKDDRTTFHEEAALELETLIQED